MIEAYSLNVTVPENSAIPFNNVVLQKGCTAVLNGTSTIQLNKCGVYMVAVDCSSAAAATIQLYKNGIAQAQAISTGTTPNFVTLIQVDENNTCCPCASPTNIQVINTGDAAATFTDANITVTKVI